jgi:hypothetical protein
MVFVYGIAIDAIWLLVRTRTYTKARRTSDRQYREAGS